MKTPVQTFFENYAAALMSFSAEEISAFYQTPLTIYADQGIQQVKDAAEVIAFWKEGVKPYAVQNIERAVPAVLSEEQLSETLFTSKVHWNNYDSSDKEVGGETNFYILSQHGTEIKISGLIIMTKK